MTHYELLMTITKYVKLYRVTDDKGKHPFIIQHYELIDYGDIIPYEILSLRTVGMIFDYIYENLGWLSDNNIPLSDAEWYLERGA